MRRYAPLLLVLAITALIAAACSDAVVDNDTATVTPRTVRDTIHLSDTLRDTINVPIPRNRLREGWIYFRAPLPARGIDSIQMVVDSFSHVAVEPSSGVPGALELRAMARIPEPPANIAARGAPSWIYLYADRVELGNNGRGEKSLQGDPRNDQTGLALFVRPPFSGDLFVTTGPGHGRVMIDTVDRLRRVVHANVKASFGGAKPFVIDSITLKIGY